MKSFDFVVIGAGIAGSITAYLLREFNTLLIDKRGVLEGASRAAGAFLFPKVGFNTLYTNFINSSIISALKFYNDLGIDTHTKGVLILPRDEKDILKFKKYEKEIAISYKKIDNGFFFECGSVIEVEDVKRNLDINFKKMEVKSLKYHENYWIINNEIKAKNVILATGFEKIVDIAYINIRPIWGERIEIDAEIDSKYNQDIYFHKNCSFAKVNNIYRIGATHKRNCLSCKENIIEAKELINKANEIVDIKKYNILNIKGGFRAASVDYFPVVGKIIDTTKTLLEDRHIVKGDLPKNIFYKEGLYIINGMGGRGFSNAISCAKALKKLILEDVIDEKLDTKRLFIKWARKYGEEYLRRINVKS